MRMIPIIKCCADLIGCREIRNYGFCERYSGLTSRILDVT